MTDVETFLYQCERDYGTFFANYREGNMPLDDIRDVQYAFDVIMGALWSGSGDYAYFDYDNKDIMVYKDTPVSVAFNADFVKSCIAKLAEEDPDCSKTTSYFTANLLLSNCHDGVYLDVKDDENVSAWTYAEKHYEKPLSDDANKDYKFMRPFVPNRLDVDKIIYSSNSMTMAHIGEQFIPFTFKDVMKDVTGRLDDVKPYFVEAKMLSDCCYYRGKCVIDGLKKYKDLLSSKDTLVNIESLNDITNRMGDQRTSSNFDDDIYNAYKDIIFSGEDLPEYGLKARSLAQFLGERVLEGMSECDDPVLTTFAVEVLAPVKCLGTEHGSVKKDCIREETLGHGDDFRFTEPGEVVLYTNGGIDKCFEYDDNAYKKLCELMSQSKDNRKILNDVFEADEKDNDLEY